MVGGRTATASRLCRIIHPRNLSWESVHGIETSVRYRSHRIGRPDPLLLAWPSDGPLQRINRRCTCRLPLTARPPGPVSFVRIGSSKRRRLHLTSPQPHRFNPSRTVSSRDRPRMKQHTNGLRPNRSGRSREKQELAVQLPARHRRTASRSSPPPVFSPPPPPAHRPAIRRGQAGQGRPHRAPLAA